MDIQIDSQTKIPFAQQIRQQIQEQIERGMLMRGSPLPPVRLLALQLGINFNTVARAYRALDQMGYLTTHQGLGTFVANRIPDQGAGDSPKIKEADLLAVWERQAQAAGFSLETVFNVWKKTATQTDDFEAERKHNRVLRQGRLLRWKKIRKAQQDQSTGAPMLVPPVEQRRRSRLFHVKQLHITRRRRS